MDEKGRVIGILAINNDITFTVAGEQALHSYNTSLVSTKEPEPISTNVSDLLDSLIGNIYVPAQDQSYDEAAGKHEHGVCHVSDALHRVEFIIRTTRTKPSAGAVYSPSVHSRAESSGL